MIEKPNRDESLGVSGHVGENERKAVLDVLGKMLMETRDRSIIHWDQMLSGKRPYAPWERVKLKFPNLDDSSLDLLRSVIPHVIDTCIYNLLAELDASHSNGVRISVTYNGKTYPDVARISWGLVGEPMSEEGWLVRFSKQRFEQPI
jgi:hypothetical protein